MMMDLQTFQTMILLLMKGYDFFFCKASQEIIFFFFRNLGHGLQAMLAVIHQLLCVHVHLHVIQFKVVQAQALAAIHHVL